MGIKRSVSSRGIDLGISNQSFLLTIQGKMRNTNGNFFLCIFEPERRVDLSYTAIFFAFSHFNRSIQLHAMGEKLAILHLGNRIHMKLA